jgi:ABC-type transport system involved in cytochrome bd biosynthesis fused ATPase/permease subunit
VSFKIAQGKKFALVGPSGGGKTTICHLIPHFYDVGQGKILVDGHSIDEYTRESLRRNIGIVQQDIYLFNASIRENILYGRPEATEEEVVEAAKRANIHDYIMTLDEGYDTVIGERGVRLSGGQKQRLSIARVFLKDPAILILDEATSALDNTTEILIQHALDELCVGRTTLVVVHRLSTIKNADEIAVIADGKIVEQGNHDALVAEDGIYAKLYRHIIHIAHSADNLLLLCRQSRHIKALGTQLSNSLIENLLVGLKTDIGNKSALLGTQQISRATDIQILHSDIESRTQIGELLNRPQSTACIVRQQLIWPT